MRHSIVAWLRGGLLLETYRYAPGPAQELPKHSHGEYHFFRDRRQIPW